MLGKFFDSLFNKHKFVRRIIVLWSLMIISWAVYIIIPKLEQGYAVSGLSIVVSIFTVITTFYMYLRGKDGD